MLSMFSLLCSVIILSLLPLSKWKVFLRCSMFTPIPIWLSEILVSGLSKGCYPYALSYSNYFEHTMNSRSMQIGALAHCISFITAGNSSKPIIRAIQLNYQHFEGLHRWRKCRNHQSHLYNGRIFRQFYDLINTRTYFNDLRPGFHPYTSDSFITLLSSYISNILIPLSYVPQLVLDATPHIHCCLVWAMKITGLQMLLFSGISWTKI